MEEESGWNHSLEKAQHFIFQFQVEEEEILAYGNKS